MTKKKDLIYHPRYGLTLAWAKEVQRTAKRAGWPGLPTGQIPLMCSPQMHAMIADGMATLITRPARVNPAHTREFIALTDQGEQEWSRLARMGRDAFAAEFVSSGRIPVEAQPLSGVR